MTPKETVRACCTNCLGMKQHNADEIRDCRGDQAFAGACPFFPYRLGKRISVKVFRAFCLQCMGGNRDLVRECEALSCPAYPYRFGKNPARQGIGGNISQYARESGKSRQESTCEGQDIGSYREAS